MLTNERVDLDGMSWVLHALFVVVMMLGHSFCASHWIELNGIWVQALPGLLRLDLKTGPLCPMFCTKLKEPCSFSKVPDGPYTWFPNILRVQKQDTQVCMSEWSQCLTLTQNVDCGFLLSTAFPTGGVITQSHYTGCPGGNVPDFGRMFLKLKYTDITKNTYIRSWTVTEIKAREKCGLLAVPRTVPGSRDVLPVRCTCPSLSTAGSSTLHGATARVKCLEPWGQLRH